ncbi:MAG: hypothetical protein QOD26_674 [Betaproteobacteria bacterium]|jgi:hypothetical protein|nr:hypothetical protein [Betaproteobacteria bacterium]
MYEHRADQLLPGRLFLRRLSLHAAAALLIVLASTGIGMAGYMYFEHLPWRDAFLNSAMLLGGMGPVDAPKTDGGKLFAGCYALYAGLVFLITVGVVLAPMLHRLLHRFHWNQKG